MKRINKITNVKHNSSNSVKARLKTFFIVFAIIMLVGFGIVLSISRSLIREGYRRYGTIKGTLLIPRAMFCKWEGSSAKAEDICMGFLWGDKSGSKGKNSLEQTLKWAIENSASIELLPLTYFDWDTLYIFGPYTPLESINEQLGYSWIDTKSILPIGKKTSINELDDRNLLVFTKNNQVVFNMDFPRSMGDFVIDASKNVFTPTNAVFQIEKRRDGGTNLIPKEHISVKTNCPFEDYIPHEERSQNTTCTLSTISGYSLMYLIVLDELSDGYKVRIFGNIPYRDTTMQNVHVVLEYEQMIPFDVDSGSIWIVHDPFDRTILKKYIDHKPIQVGLFHKDDTGYSLIWKN